MLKIYNSLSKQKETFVPIQEKHVRMYVCGMTVYDYCHLGHARVMIVFDMVYRYLKFMGYTVDYVRNITDIDDKIIKRANENHEPFTALVERFIEKMHEDEAALGVQPPTQEPRATDNIDEILSMITRLIEKGYAYQGEKTGDIYYRVKQFADYGKLSGRNLEELQAGERVKIDDDKENPLDFVLWKMAKPHEPSWHSSWGDGRPGWHIECSAMSTKTLGAHFDIHGGGHDLQFPHHENEIAQSEACTGQKYVNYWMHNGFIRINEEKMSKSLGNFFTIREVMEHYKAEEIRYFMLTSQYRSPLNYSTAQLDDCRNALNRLYNALDELSLEDTSITIAHAPILTERFHQAMQDDFNTPEALAVLFELAKYINRAKQHHDTAQAASYAKLLIHLAEPLGLLQQHPQAWFNQRTDANEQGLSDADIDDLLQQRVHARQNKNWAEADRIRDLLNAENIIVEDKAGKTRWRRG
ncbi:MAG: cysteine--tRNA ligase [bacterium]